MRARANGHTAAAYSAWPEHAILDDSGVVALIARRAGRELRPQACTVHSGACSPQCACQSAPVRQPCAVLRSSAAGRCRWPTVAPTQTESPSDPHPPSVPLSLSFRQGVGSSAHASAARGAPMRSIRIECACRSAVRRSLESSIPALGALPVFHFHWQSSYASRISG
jgi:hypothetical protein